MQFFGVDSSFMGNSLVKTATLMLAMGVVLPATVQLVAPQSAFAQSVTGIIVEGNARVEPDTVRAYMQFNAGEQVSDAQIDASVKALFQTCLLYTSDAADDRPRV